MPWLRRDKNPNTEAVTALKEAKQNLRKVKSRDKEVHAISEESKRLRRNNHFAIDLQSMFEGGAK